MRGARGAAKGRLRVAEAEPAGLAERAEGAAGVDAARRWRRAAEGGQHRPDEGAKRERAAALSGSLVRLRHGILVNLPEWDSTGRESVAVSWVCTEIACPMALIS